MNIDTAEARTYLAQTVYVRTLPQRVGMDVNALLAEFVAFIEGKPDALDACTLLNEAYALLRRQPAPHYPRARVLASPHDLVEALAFRVERVVA